MPTAFDITFDTLTASFITSGSLSHTKASVVPCILKSWSVERRFELVVVAVDRLDFSVFVVFSLSVNRFGVDFSEDLDTCQLRLGASVTWGEVPDLVIGATGEEERNLLLELLRVAAVRIHPLMGTDAE